MKQLSIPSLVLMTCLALIGETQCKSVYEPQISTADQFWDERHHRRNLEELVVPCLVDADCPDQPWMVCGIKTDKVCGHKGVFPVEPLEIGGIIIFAVVMALSNIAGVGGGGVAIPIIMAFFFFNTKPAIAISSFSIFLTTFARFFMNFRERHPEKDNVVVIDYDLVCIMMPTTLAGAQIGAIILVVFPSILIQIILTLMLTFLTWSSIRKALQLTRKENAAALAKQVKPVNDLDANPDNSSRQPVIEQEGGVELVDRVEANAETERRETVENRAADDIVLQPTPGQDIKVEDISAQAHDDQDQQQPNKPEVKIQNEEENYDKLLKCSILPDMDKKELASLRFSIKAEASHFQWVKQAICISLLAALILMNLCMGSSSTKSIVGIERCSAAYWLIQVAFLIICFVCAILAVKIAKRDQALKLKYGGINVSDSDVRYNDSKRLTLLLILGFVGGWVAGALGLGGGSVYNPALLALGIPPKVASATGLYLVTFSKIASVLVYYLNDQLDVQYGCWIGFWSCLGMVAGLLITQAYMKKTGRQSIIVWCLVVIFAVSVVAIPIFGGLSLKKESDEGLDLMAFNDLCAVKK